MKNFLILPRIYSDKCSGYGILEFNTEKAGQDVTPLNFQFSENNQSRSTINSITGKRGVDG